MPRTPPENRFKQLIQAATREFIAQGYRRTQIADVARAMGVAKGTVYLYVESKEALFAAALRYADGEPPALSELDLPIPTPRPGALSRSVRAGFSQARDPETLVRALGRKRVRDVRGEIEAIVRELYATSSRHRTRIKLIERGREHPELSSLFFYDEGRFAQLELLVRYFESRKRRLRTLPDTAVTARFVIEAVATWAVHIHWDPAPQPIDPSDAEETLVRFLLAGLLPD